MRRAGTGVSAVSASALEIAVRRCREVRSVSDLGAVVSGPVRQAVGATAAALLLRNDDGSSLVLVSHPGLGDADLAEYQRIDAHSSGMPAALVASQARPMPIASNARYAERWPMLARERAALGLEAAFIMPLRFDDTVVAVLTFDYGTPRTFDTLERTGFARVSAVCAETLQRLREHAATSSSSQSRDRTARDATMRSLQRRAADLELALQRRAVIERTKGILMERHGLDADQAFELLRRTARSRQQPVIHLARTISEAHALLPTRPTVDRSSHVPAGAGRPCEACNESRPQPAQRGHDRDRS